MCCLRPYSFFFSVPMTCLFLSNGLSNLSTVLRNWSFRSSMSVCLPSDVLCRILCHRSNFSHTTLREDCLISIFLAWHGQFSKFCNALQLYFVKCHFEIPLESGEFWFYVRADSKLFPRRFAIITLLSFWEIKKNQFSRNSQEFLISVQFLEIWENGVNEEKLGWTLSIWF